MTRAYRHTWARPIFFQGIELPGTAYAIDHLGLHNNLPELSEESGLWLWHFTICVGVTKQDKSNRIIKAADEAYHKTRAARQQLLQLVPKHFEGSFDDQVIDEWITALRMIVLIAMKKRLCSWTAPINWQEIPHPGPPEQPHLQASTLSLFSMPK